MEEKEDGEDKRSPLDVMDQQYVPKRNASLRHQDGRAEVTQGDWNSKYLGSTAGN